MSGNVFMVGFAELDVALDIPHATPAERLTGLDEIVDRLIPELQERGAYRTEYTGPPCANTSDSERRGPGADHDARQVRSAKDSRFATKI